MEKLLIISYITNTTNIENFIKNFTNIEKKDIILINNLNIDININNVKIYKNMNNQNINYIIKNHTDSNFVLFTNTNVIFNCNIINWLNQIIIENNESYYLNNFIKIDNNYDKDKLYDNNFNEFINNIDYISNIGLIDNKSKLEKFINEYNTKQYLFQYDNINDNKIIIKTSYNFLLIHKNIINKYGCLSNNNFHNLEQTIINYFNNLKYINILPYVLSNFIIYQEENFTSINKVRNIFIGNKNEEGIERERKDKKIKQLTNENNKLNIDLNSINEIKNDLQKKIDNIKDILF
jgi:hypothetical protein